MNGCRSPDALPSPPVAAGRQLHVNRPAPATQRLLRVGVEGPGQAQVQPLVLEHRHAVDLQARRVIGVRREHHLRRGPMHEVVADRPTDQPHHPAAHPCGGAGIGHVLTQRLVPAEQVVRIARPADHRVAGVPGPVEAVGRKRHRDVGNAGVPLHRAVPIEHLVAAGRVRIVRLFDHVRQTDLVQHHVVVRVPVNLDDTQRRLLPEDAVPRGGIRRDVGNRSVPLVPHAEQALRRVVEDGAVDGDSALQRVGRVDDRVADVLGRLVQTRAMPCVSATSQSSMKSWRRPAISGAAVLVSAISSLLRPATVADHTYPDHLPATGRCLPLSNPPPD